MWGKEPLHLQSFGEVVKFTLDSASTYAGSPRKWRLLVENAQKYSLRSCLSQGYSYKVNRGTCSIAQVMA